MGLEMAPKDWLQIIVLILGFTVQAVIVRNDVEWIKSTLIRHEGLIMATLAKGKE